MNQKAITSRQEVEVLQPQSDLERRYSRTCECGRRMTHRVATSDRPIYANQHRWNCSLKSGGCGNADAWVEPLEAMASIPRTEADVPGQFDVILRRGPDIVDHQAHTYPKKDASGILLPDPELEGGRIEEADDDWTSVVPNKEV